MIDKEIKPYSVYTTGEAERFLRVSESTVKRLLKNGLLKANKVGKQYRIMGKELLRLVSPEAERGAERAYLSIKKKVVNKINKW